MLKKSVSELLEEAKRRALSLSLPYQGALFPSEVVTLVDAGLELIIIDVRTKAELVFVGHVPGSIHIEWQFFPSGQINPDFIDLMKKSIAVEKHVVFMCRSGARSHEAAIFAHSEGYIQVFNMAEGFEGDLDSQGHRNGTNGWRHARLPWRQS